jgi:hypothetical protein
MIYLYVKTHNKTGLKYLGKTKQKNPHSYKGSGTRWLKHIKKHGYDVTTEIIFQSKNPKEIKAQGIYYSKLWDVVDNDSWANLKEESGDGGWNYKLAKMGMLKKHGVEHSMQNPESLRKNLEAGAKTMIDRYGVNNNFKRLDVREKAIQGMIEKYGCANPMQVPEIKKKRAETFKLIEHQQGPKNSQYGLMWITNECESIRISKDDTIPVGWRKGRVVDPIGNKIKAEEKQQKRLIRKEQEERKRQELIERFTFLYEIYKEKGFQGVIDAGFTSSQQYLVMTFAKYLPHFIPCRGKQRKQ